MKIGIVGKSRYIDADKLIQHLEDEIKGCEPPFGGRANGKSIAYGTALGLKSAISFANTLPTADVVKVVRCKDCKHNVANWQHDELDIEDYTDIVCDYFMTDGMEANDYCSHGERSENGT